MVPIVAAGTQRVIDLIENVDPLLSNDYVYIIANKPIYVFHVSGFEGEMGGALVPTIDGCTGSLDVTVVRAKTGPFYLTIMTHADALNSFQISKNGGAFAPFLTAADFEYSGYGDLWIIKKSSYDRSIDAVAGEPTRIRNTKNYFHLGVINEGTGTCEYGYFSDFAEARGSAFIVESGTDIITQCYGTETQLKANGGLNYSWTPTTYLDDPLSSEPNAYLPVGIHTFSVLIDRVCFDDTTINTSVEVYENTESFFTLDDNIGCAPFTVEINNLTLNADTFLFDFEDDRNYDFFTNSNSTITHTYQNITSSDSIYTLRLLAYDKQKDCPDIYTKTIRVFPEINANLASLPSIGCNPLTVNFTDLSTSPTSDNYLWLFGDGESYTTSVSPANVAHVYKHFNTTDTANFNVELIATSPYFCRDTARATIQVFPYIEGEFTIDTAYGCSPLTITVTNNSAGEDSIILDFGDGTVYNYSSTSFTTRNHTYINNGAAVDTIEIVLTALNDEGCPKIWRDTVIVYPKVTANYTIDGANPVAPYTGCNTRTFNFDASSSTNETKYLWTFGDGSNTSNAIFAKTYDNTTSSDQPYLLNLRVESPYGCWDDTTQNITIYRAYADYTVDYTEGCSPLSINITDESDGSNLTYNWTFNNGDIPSTDPQPSNPRIYSNTTAAITTPHLLLRVEGNGGCFTTKDQEITVNPEISVTIPTLDQLICDSTTVNFTSTITNSGLPSVNYLWDFGDGSSVSGTPAPNTSHLFRNTTSATFKDYTVRLDVTTQQGCTNFATRNVRVYPKVKAEYTIDKTAGCSPLTVNAVATQYLGIPAANYQWLLNGAPIHTGYDPAAYTLPANPPGDNDLYTLRLNVSDLSGTCSDFMEKTITVYDAALADFNPKNSFWCNPNTVTFDNLSQNASTYAWDFGNGSTSSAFEPSQLFSNSNPASNQPYTVKLDVTSNEGCTSSSSTTLTIYPYIKADFYTNKSEGCSPLTVNFTNTSIGPGSLTYLWDFGVPGNSTATNPSVVFSNNTGSTITRTVRLTITGPGSCTSVKTMDIDVFSEIDVNFTNVPVDPVVICDSNNVVFAPTLTPLVGGTTYSWNFGDGTSATSTGIANQTHLYRNLNNTTSATYSVSVLAETPQGCIDLATKNVIVRPYVKSTFTIDNTGGCSPTFAVNPLAVYLPGITTYSWNFGDGTPLVSGQDPAAHTYPVNTTGGDVPYNITLTVKDHSNECSSVSTKSVTSFSEIVADFSPQGSFGCNPYSVNFVNNSSILASSSFLWEFGDGSTSNLTTPPTKTFLNSTNATKPYNVKLTATSNRGCTHDTTATVNVYRYNNADFAINKTDGCSPLTVSVTNNSRGGQYYWFWDDDDLTLANRDRFSTSDIESFEVVYTNTSGVTEKHNLTVIAFNGNCYDTLKREITVYSSIIADFNYVQTDTCNPSDVVFTNTSTGGGSYTMNWDFGDGTSVATTSNTINKTFTNNSTDDKIYTVILSALSENGCPDTHQENVTVYSRVEASFNIPTSQGCPGAATQLFPATIENTSIGNAANTYQWYVDNVPMGPTNKDNFVHDYFNDQPAPRTYNIRLVATNPHGCTSEKTGTITVFEYVDALFSITNPAGCTPWDVELVNQSTAPVTNTNYLWEYGDNTSSGISDPVHTHLFYNESRTTDRPYTITLKVTSQNYCSDVFTALPITIYHQPLAKFYVDPKSSCPPLDATMNNFDSKGYNLYRWIYGDGDSTTINSTIGESRPYSYPNTSIDVTQNYWLKLYVESDHGCWHMDSTMLNVFPDVIADFTYDLAGCSPFVANFTNNSTSPATQFYWDFKDGSNSNQEDVLHRFVNDTYFDKVFNVKLTATSDYNCWDTISKPVTVYAQPVAMFNPTPIVQTFPEASVQLNSVSNDQPWDYLWTFDDGQFSTSSGEIFHDYTHWGERNIKLELQSTTSNCADTITRTIMIYPPAVNAAFTVDTDRGCEPLDVQFTAAASVYTEIYNFEWDFGDGSTGTGATPIHLYDSAGTYYVKMTARGEGGEDYEYRTIRVYKNPKANFSLTPNNTTLNTDFQARVEFFNLSECAEIEGCNYLWKFGDGNTSAENQLVYNYTELGVYDVTLVASTKEQGCVDSMVVIGAVTVEGEGYIKFPNAFVPNQDEEMVCKYEIKSEADLKSWIFHPDYLGVIQYELWIYNRWGELIFKTADINCGWNGYIDGKLAKQDVYVWKAQGKFTNGKAFELAGDVTLIR
ncbi:MAG: PKD domain-containing protein [Bacteroidales bacterium]